MHYPLVSAVVLSYNQAQFVVECLDRVKAQNYPNLELIINDDSSTDDSVAVIETWLAKNSSIRHQFLRSAVNRGICQSMNNALARAKGKYVSGIAADDAWVAGKLLNQVEIMERLPDQVGVIYSDALLMDEHGDLLPLTFLKSGGRNQHFSTMPQGNIQTALWRTNFIAPMTTLVRRECYERVGLFDESLFAEDWDMWLRISRHYDFVFSPEIAAKYRMVRNSASNGQFGRLLDDMCLTCVKHLKSGQLEPDARQAAGLKLHALASSSFTQKSPRHKQNLFQALQYRPSAGIAGRLLFAWCGLDSKSCETARLAVRKLSFQSN
jgi:glycosyltransferase involved in cell wall biosynthesis